MKKYLIVHKDQVELSSDLQKCKSPIHDTWHTTDIFNDGYPVSQDDFDDWPWFVFDYDTGVLYDMAGTEKDAIEVIETAYCGEYVTLDLLKQNEHEDSYKRAMGIL